MTEAELEAAVLTECGRLGLQVLVIPDSRRITYGRGYPDMTIVGRQAMLWAELKAEDGRVSSDQLRWKYALQATGGRWVLWQPRHWESGQIRRELERLNRA